MLNTADMSRITARPAARSSDWNDAICAAEYFPSGPGIVVPIP
jgi:hypothetical protein